jgi:hypothetical protein
MKLRKISKTNEFKEIEFKFVKDNFNKLDLNILGINNKWYKINSFWFVKNGNGVTITTKYGKLICDNKHRVLTNNGFKFADSLNNDLLCGYNNELLTFNIDNNDKQYEFYDISIDSPHAYYTSGIISHNSLVMVNTSIANVMMGRNVLHVSLENDEKVTGNRYLGAFTNSPIRTRIEKKELLKESIRKIRTSTTSDLYILFFPTDTISVDAIEIAVKDLKRQYNFTPDVLCVDYLECLLSRVNSKNKDDYGRQKAVSSEFRALVAKTNTFGVTASQTNRSSVGGEGGPINLDKLAESFGKSMPLDYCISINQNNEEYTGNNQDGHAQSHVGRFRFFMAKNRNGRKGFVVNSSVNYATMKVMEDSTSV